MTETAELRVFGKYRVCAGPDGGPFALGRGAFGTTYRAQAHGGGREVALKVIHDNLVADKKVRARFVQEAREHRKLNHPGIARILDHGEEGGHLFYVMEYCRGGNLGQFVSSRGPIPVLDALRIVRQVADALVYAHGYGLIHRDLKPDNLMLFDEAVAGEEPQVKVIDFGLVKRVREQAGVVASHLSQSGGFHGTLNYASPEQVREEPLDKSSDIFALGMTAWHLIHGGFPVAGADSGFKVIQDRTSDESYAHRLPESLPDCVREVLARMIEKKRQLRYSECGELVMALDLAIEKMEHLASEAADREGVDVISLPPAPQRLPLGEFYSMAPAGNLDLGFLFDGTDLKTGGQVELLILRPDLDKSLHAEIRESVIRIRDYPHAAILPLSWMEPRNGDTVVRHVPQCGTLLDSLRQEGQKKLDAVIPLLISAASAFDHATRLGLRGLDASPRSVYRPDRDTIIIPARLCGTRGGGTVDPAASGTLVRTLGATQQPDFSAPGSEQNTLSQFATLAYWLLSAAPPPQMALYSPNSYRSIQGLLESSNNLLRDALADLATGSCEELLQHILNIEGKTAEFPPHAELPDRKTVADTAVTIVVPPAVAASGTRVKSESPTGGSTIAPIPGSGSFGGMDFEFIHRLTGDMLAKQKLAEEELAKERKAREDAERKHREEAERIRRDAERQTALARDVARKQAAEIAARREEDLKAGREAAMREAEARVREQAEAQRAEAERRNADAAAELQRQKAEAEAKARAREEAFEKERKERAEAEERLRKEAEESRQTERRERAEVEERLRKEAEEVRQKERHEREETERVAKEAERVAREELAKERKAREEELAKERKTREEELAKERAAREEELARERKAREEAERLASLNAGQAATEQIEKERRERAEAERAAREELAKERKAREEAERRAKEELAAEKRIAALAAQKATAEAERKAKEELERARLANLELERQKKASDEAARKAREEADRKVEIERKAREEVEKKAKAEAETAARKAREETERKAKEEVERERKAKLELERQKKDAEELARKTKEEADKATRAARAEADRRLEKEREALEKERRARADAERRASQTRAPLWKRVSGWAALFAILGGAGYGVYDYIEHHRGHEGDVPPEANYVSILGFDSDYSGETLDSNIISASVPATSKSLRIKGASNGSFHLFLDGSKDEDNVIFRAAGYIDRHETIAALKQQKLQRITLKRKPNCELTINSSADQREAKHIKDLVIEVIPPGKPARPLDTKIDSSGKTSFYCPNDCKFQIIANVVRSPGSEETVRVPFLPGTERTELNQLLHKRESATRTPKVTITLPGPLPDAFQAAGRITLPFVFIKDPVSELVNQEFSYVVSRFFSRTTAAGSQSDSFYYSAVGESANALHTLYDITVRALNFAGDPREKKEVKNGETDWIKLATETDGIEWPKAMGDALSSLGNEEVGRLKELSGAWAGSGGGSGYADALLTCYNVRNHPNLSKVVFDATKAEKWFHDAVQKAAPKLDTWKLSKDREKEDSTATTYSSNAKLGDFKIAGICASGEYILVSSDAVVLREVYTYPKRRDEDIITSKDQSFTLGPRSDAKSPGLPVAAALPLPGSPPAKGIYAPPLWRHGVAAALPLPGSPPETFGFVEWEPPGGQARIAAKSRKAKPNDIK